MFEKRLHSLEQALMRAFSLASVPHDGMALGATPWLEGTSEFGDRRCGVAGVPSQVGALDAGGG